MNPVQFRSAVKGHPLSVLYKVCMCFFGWFVPAASWGIPLALFFYFVFLFFFSVCLLLSFDKIVTVALRTTPLWIHVHLFLFVPWLESESEKNVKGNFQL